MKSENYIFRVGSPLRDKIRNYAADGKIFTIYKILKDNPGISNANHSSPIRRAITLMTFDGELKIVGKSGNHFRYQKRNLRETGQKKHISFIPLQVAPFLPKAYSGLNTGPR